MLPFDGQGCCTCAPPRLAAWDLINGRLAKSHSTGSFENYPKTYWIVCPKAASTKPKIMDVFRDWLLAEAG